MKKSIIALSRMIHLSAMQWSAKKRIEKNKGEFIMHEELINELRHYFWDVPLVMDAARVIEQQDAELKKLRETAENKTEIS